MTHTQTPFGVIKTVYAALTRKTKPLSQWQKQTIQFDDQYINAGQLAKFKQAFPNSKDVLPSFTFIAGFKAMTQLLVQSEIPSKLAGLIHLTAQFQQNETHNWYTPYQVKASLEDYTKTDRGIEYVVTVEFHQYGKLTLSNTNVFLAKNKHYRSESKHHIKKEQNELGKVLGCFAVNLKTAVRYAFLSNDYNPIHLNNWLAKKLGLKKALIHGMYNVHKGLYLLTKHQKLEFNEVSVEFNKPCFVDKQVFLRSYQQDGKFGLFDKNGKDRFVKLQVTKKEA